MKLYSGYIGLFWYIDDEKKLISFKYSLADEIQKQGSSHITATVAHNLLWVKELSEYKQTWNFYPRGRVNFNRSRDCFELDMDSCLHNEEMISLILNDFQVDGNAVNIIPANKTNGVSKTGKQEGHYSCYNCRALDENADMNLQENVNMGFIDLDATLPEMHLNFLKENFNVDDVHTLSDEAYEELYDKLCDIEVHEVSKAIDEACGDEEKVSAFGEMVADIVTYMGNQFIEGGKRYLGD
jgi:hypothetical protein